MYSTSLDDSDHCNRGTPTTRIVLKIILTESQKDTLSKHAKEQIPNESCALLFGNTEGDKLIVREVFLTENMEKSSVNFTVSNDQLLQGYQTAEEKQLEVIGIFHSHPDSEPYPSSTDKKFMQINPVAWVIFSASTNDFKAYMLESELIEIPIVT